MNSEGLLERKIEKNPPGRHLVNVGGPRTGGVIVPYQFITGGKYTANRWRKLEIIKVEVNSKP